MIKILSSIYEQFIDSHLEFVITIRLMSDELLRSLFDDFWSVHWSNRHFGCLKLATVNKTKKTQKQLNKIYIHTRRVHITYIWFCNKNKKKFISTRNTFVELKIILLTIRINFYQNEKKIV